ncbi:30S ribosomal protein S17e [Candidatus Woesearchaeota archaeon]|nr:30S ribosomal protein S17e [Candidatus Woesearchaeota archaeon]
MGRIKTTLIKRMTNDLISEHRDELTTDFEKNKALVAELTDVSSKKMRNMIAGYVTRIMKHKEQ